MHYLLAGIWSLVLCSGWLMAAPGDIRVAWNTQSHDFGDVEVNMPDQYRFEWKNLSNRRLAVWEVTGNSMIEPNWKKIWIEPGQKGELYLSLLPTALGPFEVTVEVTLTDGTSHLKQRLHATGHIRSADEFQALVQRPVARQQSSQSSAPTHLHTTILTPPGPAEVHSPNEVWTRKTAQMTMQANETQLLNDLNALRTAPSTYIPKVEAYVASLSEWYIQDITARHEQYLKAINAANSLIRTLQSQPQLPPIAADPLAYAVLHEQGEYLQSSGKVSFVDARGRNTTQRHQSADPTVQIAHEIFYLDAQTAPIDRITLLLLLDIEDPAHPIRSRILDPKWTHAAIHQVGPVGSHTHCWVLGLLTKK